jgi:hypothetical protein
MNRLLGTPPNQITEEEKANRLREIGEAKRALCDGKRETDEEKEKFINQINALTAEEVEIDRKYPDLPPESPIVVVEVQRECLACPSSWSGKTYDGKEVYARYRWGYLSVTVDDNVIFGSQLDEDTRTDEEVLEQDGEDSFKTWKMMKDFGGGVVSFAGSLSYDELCKATDGWISWPVICD